MAKDYVSRRGDRNRSRREPERRSRISPWVLAGILIGVFIAGFFYLKMQHAHMFAEQMAEANKPAQPVTDQKPAALTKAPQPQFDFYTVLSKDGKSSAPDNAPVAQSQQANPAELLPDVPADEDTSSDDDVPVPESKPAQPAASTNEPPVITVPVSSDTESAKPNATNREQVLAEEKQRLEQELASTALPEMPTASAPKSYALVMGTFKDYGGADELRAQLALQGIEANIKEIQKDDATVYRVWLGPYTTLKSAQKQQRRLQANQIKSALVKDDQP